MTNPFKRGTAPDRARDADLHPGSFKSGHKKLGERKRGTPNLFSLDYKIALYEAVCSTVGGAWRRVMTPCSA